MRVDVIGDPLRDETIHANRRKKRDIIVPCTKRPSKNKFSHNAIICIDKVKVKQKGR